MTRMRGEMATSRRKNKQPAISKDPEQLQLDPSYESILAALGVCCSEQRDGAGPSCYILWLKHGSMERVMATLQRIKVHPLNATSDADWDIFHNNWVKKPF